MRSEIRKASVARAGSGWPVGISHFRVPLAAEPACRGFGTNTPSPGSQTVSDRYPDNSLKRGLISMGNIRTWSLALIAGIFVVVVAHQRSNADAGLAAAPPRAPQRRRHPPRPPPLGE